MCSSLPVLVCSPVCKEKKRMKKAKKQNSQNTSEARSSLYNSVHKQWLSFWSNLNKNGLK